MPSLLETLIDYALQHHASDIHLLPSANGGQVMMRIDGYLEKQTESRLAGQISANFVNLIARIKIMASLDLTQHMLAQDGGFVMRATKCQVRVSVIPFINGEGAVLRLLRTQHDMLNITDLGMDEEQTMILQKLITNPSGLILTVGPTGAGKTTSLYALLNEIQHKRIVCVEDPVEYRCEWLSQICLRNNPKMTFASCLKSFLRHDPEVIMVGEIRDHETAQIACTAALTGHLVLSSLHTESAISSIYRLYDMDVLHWLMKSIILAVVAQRQVGLLCSSCKLHLPCDSVLYQTLSQLCGKNSADFDLYMANQAGCAICNFSGQDGAIFIYELLQKQDIVWCKQNLVDKKQTKLSGASLQEKTLRLLVDGKIDIGYYYTFAQQNASA